MQGWETGVGTAALELHKKGFFGWAGEIPSTFEGAISTTWALFFLEERVRQHVREKKYTDLFFNISLFDLCLHCFGQCNKSRLFLLTHFTVVTSSVVNYSSCYII